MDINLFKKSHLANTQYRKLLIKNLQYMPKCLVLQNKMVVVAQLVRVLVCGAEGRRFEPGQPPKNAKAPKKFGAFFVGFVS